MKRLKIRTKLILSYALLVSLFFAYGAFINYNNSRMADLQATIAEETETRAYAYTYEQGINGEQFGALILSQGNPEQGQQIINGYRESVEEVELIMADRLTNDQDNLERFLFALESEDIASDIIDEIVELQNSDNPSKAELIQEKFIELTAAVTDVSVHMAEFVVESQEDIDNTMAETKNYIAFSNMVALVFLAALITISIALAYIIGRRITNPINQLKDVAEKVSMGNIDQTIDINTKDEINDLAQSFQRMINAFKMMVAMNQENPEEKKQ